jgi:GAF domain-containing protein
MRQSWLTISPANRSNAYFRVRIAINLSIALITVLVAWGPGYFSGIWLGILAADTFVLMLGRVFALRGITTRISVWGSLLTTLVIGSWAILLGGGSILLGLILYLILILAAALVFLSNRATLAMATISGLAFGARAIGEAFFFISPTNPGFVNLLESNPVVALVNLAGGYFLLVLFAIVIGRSVEYLGRWNERVELEVENKTRELQESVLREKRTASFLHLLGEVHQLIAREHDASILFQESCEIFVRERFSYAWIGKIVEDSGKIQVLAQSGSPLQFISSDIRDSLCVQKAIQSGFPVLVTIDETSEICKKCPLNPILGSGSAVAFPLSADGRLLGSLVVASKDNYFSDTEISLLQSLADDLACAFENIEIENQRKAIAKTAKNLLTAQDEKKFWPVTLTAVRSVLHADRAAVFLLDRKTDRLVCPYAKGLSQEYIETINCRFREVPGARVITSSQPVIVNDVDVDPLVAPMRAVFQKEGIRSYTVFPLFSSDKLMGALVAYRNQVIPFSHSDVDAGQTLAHLVAAALQNIRLLGVTRAKAGEMAILYAVAQDLSASIFDPPTLFETLARHLAFALDVTSVYTLSLDIHAQNFIVLSEYWSDSAGTKERKSGLGRVYSAQCKRSLYAGGCFPVFFKR